MSLNQKQSKKKTTSTARRLNTVWVLRLFGIFLGLDMLLIVIGTFGFVYSIQKHEMGAFTGFLVTDAGMDVEGEAGTGQNSELQSLYIMTENDMGTICIRANQQEHTVEYIVDKQGEQTDVDITVAVRTSEILVIGILILELLILIYNALFGVFPIRKKLRSLDQMAYIANQLGSQSNENQNMFHFDEEKVHHLEDAIARITPNGPECVLHTSDEELKGLEYAINGLLERMRAAYKQQSRFVSDASHELRTPIAVIQGYINMLDRWGKEDEKVLQESIEAIKHESEHMKKLVEQLLFLARGDSGRNRFVLEQVNLNDVVKEVYEESLMIDEDHIYHRAIMDTANYVYADVSMIKQAVRILADNAAKYTPAHEQIRIGCGIDGQNIPYLYVQDNGIGMKNEDAAHVFERFYRADNARDSKSGGTGLGLSIARWIVERHGGYFKVMSYEEIGSRISIYLPQEAVKKEWETMQQTKTTASNESI